MTTWDGEDASKGGRILAAGDRRVYDEARGLLWQDRPATGRPAKAVDATAPRKPLAVAGEFCLSQPVRGSACAAAFI